MDVGLIAVSSISGSGISLAAFYTITNWRLKKLEDNETTNQQTRERLIRIETMVTEIYNSKNKI